MVKCPYCKFRKTQNVVVRSEDNPDFVTETFMYCKVCHREWDRKEVNKYSPGDD